MQTNDVYQPPQVILQKYAELLVNFALGKDEGIATGEVVQCLIPDVAKPLALEIQNAILKAGAHVLLRILPTGFDKDYYTLASEEQLTFFPELHLKSRADLIDHSIGIIADTDPFELAGVPPQKIIAARDAKKKYRDWLIQKENQGKFTWTIALWGVEAKARIVGLTLEEYWQQIIQACFLDKADPISEWRRIKKKQISIKNKLNNLSIEWLHIKGRDVDLKIKLGANRIWRGGADRNIPSFELFTSPDWRGTSGWIKFNQPVYRYGKVLEGVELKFNRGLVSYAKAKVGNDFLQQMLKSENANKLGEFSLTDSKMSRITHPMAETLYDENMGGQYGNTHVAIGSAYRDCFRGDVKKVTEPEWAEMGYNNSAEHTDIVSTTDRTVTAILTDGTQKVIYQKGSFVL